MKLQEILVLTYHFLVCLLDVVIASVSADAEQSIVVFSHYKVYSLCLRLSAGSKKE